MADFVVSNISIEDITSVNTLEGDITLATGVYDKMALAFRAQLKSAVDEQQISQQDAGAVLAQSLPSVLNNAVQFVLSEQTAELDAHIRLKELEIKTKELELKEYELTNIVPKQLEKLEEDIETTNKQQVLLDIEKESKQYEVDNILPKQLEKLEEDIDLLQTQDDEIKSNGIKDRAIKDEQVLNEADKRLTTAKAREVQNAQKELYERQKNGYDDDKDHKIFKTSMDAWALAYSSGVLTLTPDFVTNDEISSIYEEISPTDYVAP